MTEEIAAESFPEEAPAPTQIMPEALERWQQVPDGSPLDLPLTRADLDNLMLALRSMAISQSHLVSALNAHINQDADACLKSLVTANQLCVDSFSKLNQFISALMLSAEPRAGR